MSWKRVCGAGDVAKHQIKKFDVDGIRILVANYGDGFRAIPPLCPHMEEPLEESALIEGQVMTCTKHLWQWNLKTLEMAGPAEKPLLAYEIKQDGDDVLVFVEKELEYEFDDEGGDDDDDFWY